VRIVIAFNYVRLAWQKPPHFFHSTGFGFQWTHCDWVSWSVGKLLLRFFLFLWNLNLNLRLVLVIELSFLTILNFLHDSVTMVLEKILWTAQKPPSKMIETADPANAFKEKKLDDLIDEDIKNDMNQAPSQLEVFRLRTLKFMASSWFGHIYTNFFLVVSIFSCGQYIYQTYLFDEQRV
jgi:hypothetical protein